jgi:hypothetical protein
MGATDGKPMFGVVNAWPTKSGREFEEEGLPGFCAGVRQGTADSTAAPTPRKFRRFISLIATLGLLLRKSRVEVLRKNWIKLYPNRTTNWQLESAVRSQKLLVYSNQEVVMRL